MSNSNLVRSGKAVKSSQFAPNVLDTDPVLSAESDERLATQKATKAYADTKLSQDLSLLEEMGAVSESDLMVVYDITTGVTHTTPRGVALPASATAVTQVALNALHQEIVITESGSRPVHIHPHSTLLVRNMWMTTANTVSPRGGGKAFGAQNSAILTGGTTGGHSGTSTTLSEEFLGDRWRAFIHTVVAHSQHAATGNRNAGVIHGGYASGYISTGERYNGYTFTLSGSWGGRTSHGGMGKVNSALFAGGHNGSSAQSAVFRYNGNSFSAAPEMGAQRHGFGGAGHANACIATNGYDYGISGPTDTTEKFFGEAWAASELSNTAINSPFVMGLQNACLKTGPNTINIQSTEEYNGYAWAMRPANPVNSVGGGSAGNVFAGLIAAGNISSSNSNLAAKWFGSLPMQLRVTAKNTDQEAFFVVDESLAVSVTGPAELQIDWVPRYDAARTLEDQYAWNDLERIDLGDGTWTLGASLNNARQGTASVGRMKSTLVAGGSTNNTDTGAFSSTEHHDGNAWTSRNPMNVGTLGKGAAGISNAVIVFGGRTSSQQTVDRSEHFNGSTWSNAATLTQPEHQNAPAGVMNAALSFGGGSYDVRTEKYDGVSWSTQTGWNMNHGSRFIEGCGTQTAALAVGGIDVTEVSTHRVEKFNGLSWSHTTPLNQPRRSFAIAGTQNVAMVAGGNTGHGGANITQRSEKFNGFVWVQSSETLSALFRQGGAGTQMSMLAMGGELNNGSIHNTVELFQTELSIPGPFGTATYS